jgi:patatin-like phospholipase/acyl hydrolase
MFSLRGGIRGIVELEILRSIQEEFKNQIPIRAFFDLIVGTR